MRALFLLAIILAVSANDAPQKYSSIKSIFTGFLSGFLGEPYDMSDKCLDPATGDMIDAALVQITMAAI